MMMRPGGSRNGRSERGQTMVEFALVMPLLALLLFGVIQFGIAFKSYITLTDATRAGARKAAVSRRASDPVGDAKAEVKASAQDLTVSDLDITVTPSVPWQPGADVTVTATYPYSISLLGVVVKSGRLTSSTTERVE